MTQDLKMTPSEVAKIYETKEAHFEVIAYIKAISILGAWVKNPNLPKSHWEVCTTKLANHIPATKVKYIETMISTLKTHEAVLAGAKPVDLVNSTVISGGKYDGITFGELVKKDPRYVKWSIEKGFLFKTSNVNVNTTDSFRYFSAKYSLENSTKLLIRRTAVDILNDELNKLEESEAEKRAFKKLMSQHVGTVGEKMEFTAKVIGVFSFDGRFGTITSVLMVSGNDKLVWKTSNPKNLDKGMDVKFIATVKAHSEYKGECQTEIKLPKFIEV